MNICVLLTCVGGLVSPGIIDNLRNIPEVSRIIGVDARPGAIGFRMVDNDYLVPPGDAPEYLKAVSGIVRREAVDVIIPCSDEEVLSLSRIKKTFEEKGVTILCSPYEITSRAIDKGSMLTFLRKCGLPVPRFFLPGSAAELIREAGELGYPDNPVVIKPRRGRGGRGFKILRENIDLLESRDSNDLKLNWFMETIKQQDIKKTVLMEYLPGDDYSVDVLADHGRLKYIVPRKRIKAILGPSQLGEVIWNQKVVDITESIVKHFGFNSNVNIQLKYSAQPEQFPMIYEINPRVSGTIVASTAGGLDLLYYGIRHALGFHLPSGLKAHPVKMMRYLKEYFVGEQSLTSEVH